MKNKQKEWHPATKPLIFKKTLFYKLVSGIQGQTKTHEAY
jgi:hypothetical protein